ncbi:uncharacterized protein BDR25DRAFT_314484 [Lindgomyces ingoldianus]|uniref:Uncharacterized protein n=1 Tax=Lindgomyces ingoldianus TaxID=673940 RepID=A0ACB6QUY6_9PLEO|nr:uncharacterized protein BDR25DRAFT_314484 [Lindgomyces ingoldianus]KAF2470819.1 hypothetical protein BDR25DRAFT_314484 [Lindgomyces ingoldianus]
MTLRPTQALFGVVLCCLLMPSQGSPVLPRSPNSETLFKGETIQLTAAVLDAITQDEITAPYSRLFSFDDNPQIAHEQRQRKACKTFPGDEDWPSRLARNAFNKTLNGAPISTVPIGASCYVSNFGPKDDKKCSYVTSNFNQPSVHV